MKAFVVLVLLLRGSRQTEALLWPFGDGLDPYPLRATYGQIEGEDDDVDLHYGLDVVARAKPEAVYALEAGKVVKVRTDEGYRSGVLVESDAGPLLLYLHLQASTIQVAKDELVEKDQYLGDVVYNDPSHPRHLHLSRLAEANHYWSGIDRFSSANPLPLLDPEVLGDDAKPEILEVGGSEKFAVRDDEDPNTTASPHYHDLDSLPAGELDVIARLRDRDATRDHDLAPFWVRLEIEPASGPALVFETTLEGELKPLEDEERALYNLDDEYPSGDDGAYFVLTNGGPNPSIDGCWRSTPGLYTLRVTVRDVAGSETAYERNVTVE